MPKDRGHGPGRPHPVRTRDERLALGLLLDSGPLTRRQLGDRTGLSIPTATALLDRLERAGAAVRTTGSGPRGRGPVAAVYDVPPDAVLSAAVDVGRGAARAEVLDVSGRVLAGATSALVTGRTPAWRVLRDVLGAACAAAGVPVEALAHAVVGIGGAYDAAADRLANSRHLPAWTGTDLARTLGHRLGLRVVLENDANLALVAELVAHGVDGGDDAGTAALLWFGDGVGLAVALDGRLHRGASGRAGEVGYLLAPPPYGDGRRDLQSLLGAGGLESLAAGYALAAAPRDGASGDGGTDPAARVHGLLVGAVALARSESRGRAARSFLGDVADLVAVALQPLLAVLDPATVVLGGPAGPAGANLLADLVAGRLRAQGRWFGGVRAATATDAVLAGARRVAAGLARELLLDRICEGAEQVAT